MSRANLLSYVDGYGYGYGYYGRYGRNDDLAAQEDQQGLVQGQQGSSATRV